jgi:hypothetical protein
MKVAGGESNVHYAKGPAQNGEQSYMSRYAAAHPWEDWADLSSDDSDEQARV